MDLFTKLAEIAIYALAAACLAAIVAGCAGWITPEQCEAAVLITSWSAIGIFGLICGILVVLVGLIIRG